MIEHIVIVGGGSAGWITAGTLAAAHGAKQSQPIRFTLIESPDVNTIGVGEGTWPSMRSTLDLMGIDEDTFVNSCQASFKQGSQFEGWCTGDADDVYYHPFVTPLGYEQTNLARHWANQHHQHAFADCVSLQSHMCQAGRAPKQFSTPGFAGVANYGYHLDAGKFAALLHQHCVNVLGVNYIKDTVVEVLSHSNQDIKGLMTETHGLIEADLFIDCSGAKSLLLGQHYNVSLNPQKDVLFNDAAIVAQVPYEHETSDIASATIATAKPVGWTWDIGLANRRGVGYVFSQAHISDEDAFGCLDEHINATSSPDVAAKVQARKITFTPGYRQKFWHRNCVAVGMSAGFIEPLEASALAMVELSCAMLKEQMPVDRQHMEVLSQRFNQRFEYRWERVIEFLKLHYVLSSRNELYWRAHRDENTIPERLQALLALWKWQSPSRHDFIDNDEVFPSASYQYILYGMRHTTLPRTFGSDLNDDQLSAKLFADNWQKRDKYIAALPTNRALIDHINSRMRQPIKPTGVAV